MRHRDVTYYMTLTRATQRASDSKRSARIREWARIW